jgi:putative membrane protein
MLRYLLLASATAVAMPAVALAQTYQPAPASEASDFDRSGAAYYYASAQDTAQPDYGAPPAPGATQPLQNPEIQPNPNAPGYYTSPPQPAETPPQAAEAATPPAPGSLYYEAGQPVVIVAAQPVDSQEFLNKSAMNNRYQILAAAVALRRGQSDTVRQTASGVLGAKVQTTVTLADAAREANMRSSRGLDFAYRARLARLLVVPTASFDRVYMNQQLTAQMISVALQKSYAQSGDNPQLQAAAQQNQQVAQQSLNTTWENSGQPQRLARLRDDRFQALAQNSTRATTFRGYTVFGPTSASQAPARDEEDYTTPFESSPGGSPQSGTPQYQGYTQTQPGISQPGTATGSFQNQPGAPGYGAGVYNQNPNAPVGTPSYQGYTSPQTTPYYNGSPTYQGYTSQPSYNPSPLQSGPTGVPAPGAGYNPSPNDQNMNAPRPPGYTTPSSPDYMTPPVVQPQSTPPAVGPSGPQ